MSVSLAAADPPEASDATVRQRIRTELDRTFFVEAGAGTGKTRELVARIVALVEQGQSIERLAAITFTEAAAAELRDRVRLELEAASQTAATASARFSCSKAAQELDLAAIQTIHAFAGGLLRLFPLEAGLPPGFSTMDELQRDIAFEERFRTWFYEEAPNGDGSREAAAQALILGLSPKTIRLLAARMQNHQDLLTTDMRWNPGESGDPVRVAREIGTKLLALEPLLTQATDRGNRLAEEIRTVLPAARRMIEVAGVEEALLLLTRFLDQKPSPAGCGEDRWGAGIEADPAQRIKYVFKDTSARADAEVRRCRIASMAALLPYLRDFTQTWTDERRATGAATFHDLLTWARDLLRDHPDVRRRAHERFERVLVDEFQDTDPLQLEIVWFLTASPDQASERDWRKLAPVPGRLFVVGDPKQSIYRFRRADVGLYQEVLEGLGAGAEVLALTQNFRSAPPLLAWVNHHLGREMRAQRGVQPEYRALRSEEPPAQRTLRIAGEDGPIEPGVWTIGGRMEGTAADRWQAEAAGVAAVAHRIVVEGWPVSRRTATGIEHGAARYEDICVLLPTRTNLRRLERQFDAQAVPYRMESGSLVLNTAEVRDLLSCLRAIDDSSDQVALVAALRSPAYACSDVDLLEWVEAGGRLDYLHPAAAVESVVGAALASLCAFHEARAFRSPAATIEMFIRERMLAVQALGQSRPREAWRRLRYVVNQARRLAASGHATLRAAVEWLEGLQRETFYDPESAVPESDEDAVRFMTVHGSKGLEFPIVILSGLGTAYRARNGPHLAFDAATSSLQVYLNQRFFTSAWDRGREGQMDVAEQVRLLYVASTRARDHMVLSLFHENEHSHAFRIVAGLAEAPHLCRQLELDISAVPAPGMFAVDTALSETAANDQRRSEQAWLDERKALIAALGTQKRFTATSLGHERRTDTPEPEEDLDGDTNATEEDEAPTDAPDEPDLVLWLPRGRAATALGLAVHSVLQTIDLSTLDGLAGLAESAATSRGIPERTDEVAALVRSAAASEAVQSALAAPRHWREAPVGITHDGVLLEGYADLLYERANGSIGIVDYKTDIVTSDTVAQRAGTYRLQGGAYALAVERTTGRTVSSVEFVFASLGRTVTFGQDAVEHMIAEAAAAMNGDDSLTP